MNNTLHQSNLIITADDFGISQGVNQAIEKAFLTGGLSHASLLANGKYFDQAIEIAKKHPKLNVGLHFNLTFDQPLIQENPARSRGQFHKSFFGYLLGTKKPNLIKQELIAQITKLQKAGIKISHIDGHHHIHMIPYIFKIVQQVAAEFGIERIRIINEPFLPSFRARPSIKSLFLRGGIYKWLLFRLLYLINGKKSDCYFFSILYSCMISKEMISKFKLPKNYQRCEIMLHPGDAILDADWQGSERPHLLSENRKIELETALKIPK
jgi:chitin disaccharide deacetylase